MSNRDLFSVEQDDSHLQPFQNFNSTIQSDLPGGRISPSHLSSNSMPSAPTATNLYETAGRLNSSLTNSTKSGGLFALDSYTGYFDVDTMTVVTRCWKTLVPKEDYVDEVLDGNVDLYGPFWVPTTLIFSLFLTSSLASSIGAYLAGESYTYDFTRLGAAVTLVYTYSLGLPVVVWAAMKYWGGIHDRSAVELVSLYGYSASIWILVSWLSLIPYTPLRIVLLFSATLLSLAFLLRNLYPVIARAPNLSARLLIIVVGVLQVGLAMGLWFGFMSGGGGRFNQGGSTGTVGGDPVGGLPGGGDEEGLRMLF